MAQAKLLASQIATLKSLRSLDPAAAAPVRSALFASFKDSFGIPFDHKVKVEVDNADAPNYGLIVRKKDGTTYGLDSYGKWSGSVTAAPAPVAPAPVAPRWFLVDMGDVVGDIINDADFDEGDSAVPGGPSQELTIQSYKCAIDSDGDMWVQLDQSRF